MHAKNAALPFHGREMMSKAKEISMDKESLLKDMMQANEEASLIRKAYNEETWDEYEKCSFAFFPGCQLGAAEPELVIKAYDSIRFQHPDTGIFLHCCGFPALLAEAHVLMEKTMSELKSGWESLGKPVIIMACMSCCRIFNERLPDIPTISIYKLLKDMGVSGGCNSTDYIIMDPPSLSEGDETPAIVRSLAEEMGVKLHEAAEKASEAEWVTKAEGEIKGENPEGEIKRAKPVDDKTDAAGFPYLVYSIAQRDEIKRQGKDAVHILELIYGMGDSNAHLEHEHDHGEHDLQEVQDSHDDRDASDAQDCDGICGSCALGCCPSLINISALLPDDRQRFSNRLELKEALLEFFWNEA